MKWLGRIVTLLLVIGMAALAYVMFVLPPNDPDAFAMARERETRRQAYRLHKPLPGADVNSDTLDVRLARTGFTLGQPIFMRIFKLTFELEVWMKRGDTYALFATYPICYFSGQLGPKIRSFDRQTPEGIYQVTAKQLNPASRWHRSFNLGFPNAYDRAQGRTGSYLMVHGGCSSVGCYAMTNPVADDLFRLATAAFAAGQSSFQVQALPFRMTTDAMASRTTHPNAPFWDELRTVSDGFEMTHRPPEVVVCDGHYRIAKGDVLNVAIKSCKKI